jgi:hypothetical protein
MKVEPFPFKIIALDPVFQMFGCEASRSARIRRSFRQRSIYRRKDAPSPSWLFSPRSFYLSPGSFK